MKRISCFIRRLHSFLCRPPRNPFYEKLIKGLQQALEYENVKANGEDPSQYGKSVNASAKIALGIHSPTEVAAFLGKQYAEAFNDGVEYGKDHRMTEEELAEVMAKCKAITDLFFPEAEDDDEEENDNGYQQL